MPTSSLGRSVITVDPRPRLFSWPAARRLMRQTIWQLQRPINEDEPGRTEPTRTSERSNPQRLSIFLETFTDTWMAPRWLRWAQPPFNPAWAVILHSQPLRAKIPLLSRARILFSDPIHWSRRSPLTP